MLQQGLALVRSWAAWCGVVMGLVLAAAAPAALAEPVKISIDGTQKFQTIDGFGTAVYLYMNQEPFLDHRLQEMYAKDLGNSLVRCELSPDALPAAVENVEDISWKNFAFKAGSSTLGNLEFIKAVHTLNPKIRFTPSVWSPPGWMKSNGKSAGGGTLLPKYYPHYAKYLAEWCKYVKEKYGVEIYALSPQNELAFREFYNSCIYKPATYRDLLIEIGKRFKTEGIATKVFGPEDMTESQRTPMFIRAAMEDDQAKDVLSIFASHGYSDGVKMTGGAKGNSALWQSIAKYQRPLWMSETSGVSGLWLDGDAKDKAGKPLPGSLSGVGAAIHNSLVYGQVSGWIYWQYLGSSDPLNIYDMVYVKIGPDPNNRRQQIVTDIVPSKKYFVHKHFSRYLQPGAQRIAAGPDDQQGVLVSAFVHAADGTLTIELINQATDDRPVALDLKGVGHIAAMEAYCTTAKEDWQTLNGIAAKDAHVELTLPAQSMITLYAKETH